MSTLDPPLLLTRPFAYSPSDSVELRRKKNALFIIAGGCVLAGLVWAAMYWFLFGWGFTTALPLVFVVIVGSAIVVSHRTGRHQYTVYAQIVCIMYVTALIQWSIGDLFASGFVLAWGFVGPVCSLVFFSRRVSATWFALHLINLAITLVFNDSFAGQGHEVSQTVRLIFFAMNVGISSLIVLLFAGYYVSSASAQRKRADALRRDLSAAQSKQLGAYTLESMLGRGGMGVVYLARHQLLRRPTAIKLLSTDDARPEQLARFEREVQLTSELSHPNIVAIYDYGRSAEGEFYYAMEFLSGIDLQSLVEQWEPMTAERAVPILIQVCDALSDAHYQRLIHRDIKPANIMLSKVGSRLDVVKVVDFGLVKELETDDALTADLHVAGTPAYLAPEVMVSPETVGPGCDIYALGAVGFYLLTGQNLFEGKTVAEVCAHHIHTEPRPPSLVSRHNVSEELDAILLSCLSKKPAERSDAATVRDALIGLALPEYRDGLDWWESFDASDLEPAAAVPSDESAFTVDLHGR